MRVFIRNTALAMLLTSLAVTHNAHGGGIVIGGGPTTVTWTDGAANNDWEDAGNWNVHVPQDGDAVIIDSGHHTVWLTENSADIRSLYIAGGIPVYNNYHKLSVKKNTNDATTTITGDYSSLIVSDIGGSQQDFNTDYLELHNGASLRLDGGKAHVDFDVDMTGDVSIQGNGILEVGGGGANALAFSSASELRPHDGNLRINMTGGSEIFLGGAFINVTAEDSDLILDGDMGSAIADEMRIGAGNKVDFQSAWDVTGLLRFVSGGGEVVGGPGEIHGELRVNGSVKDASVAGNLHFASSSEMNINSYGTLQLGRVSADAGHVTNLLTGSTLRVNFPNSGSQIMDWDGRINASSSIIEVNGSGLGGQTGVFRIDGRMDLGSTPFSLGYIGPTYLKGSASVYQNGTMYVTGLGGRVQNEGGMRFQNGSATTIVSGAELKVETLARVDNGASFLGAGDLVIAESGLMFAEDDAVVDVDVVNHGNVRVGMPFGSAAHLNFADNYTQSSTGTLSLDLGGTFTSQYDRLNVDDYATIDGTLEVSLMGGFTPDLGDNFLVLDTTDGLNGTFSDASLPSLAAGLTWEMDYSPFALTLSVVECMQGDANCDGEVNGVDFLFLQREYGKPGPSPADLTGDGVVDGDDIAEWQSSYPAAAVASIQGVPEPGAMILAGLMAIGAVVCRPVTSNR